VSLGGTIPPIVGAATWFSHIVVDLAFGHGLRKADGWRRRWWTWR
jgi:hypothetical protein